MGKSATVFSTETPLRLCWECGTSKPTTEFKTKLDRKGREGRANHTCRTCRSDSTPIGAPPELAGKSPSVAQLERIRELSNVVYGKPGLAFRKHGMPETTGEAAELLRRLHAERGEDMDLDSRVCDTCGVDRPMSAYSPKGRGISKTCDHCEESTTNEGDAPVTQQGTPAADPRDAVEEQRIYKVCPKCKEQKLADRDHFGSDKRTHDGLGRTCFDCKSQAASRARRKTTTGKATKSQGSEGAAPPSSDGSPPTAPSDIDLRAVFRDPRLSTLETIQAILTDRLDIPDDAVGLEDAANVAKALTDVEGWHA